MAALTFIESERLRAAFSGRTRPLLEDERRGEFVLGGAFVVVAALLAAQGPHMTLSAWATAAFYVAAIAVAGEVRIDIGTWCTIPTQVVLVPMLFAIPVAYVPALVALAMTVSMLAAIRKKQSRAGRLLLVPGNCWFAIGAPAVLFFAHVHSPYGHWDILALALAAQFAGDFISSLVRQQADSGTGVADLTREVRVVYLIDLALAPLGFAVALATVGHQWVLLTIFPLFGILHWLSNERHARMEQLIELNDAYRGTALLLGDVVEADDSYTGAHCKDVVQLALACARKLGLDLNAMREVEFTALLHDVGKIAVPKSIINKPGALDEREWDIIKTHTVEGQRMLERVGGFMREVGQSVRSHHERWDGGGYPDGLSGENIPLAARIVACCDAFNAMTTTRPYRQALPVETAVAELEDKSGTQFDPTVVLAVLKIVQELPAETVAPVPQETIALPATSL